MSATDFRALFDSGKPANYSFGKPLSLGRSGLDIEVDDAPPTQVVKSYIAPTKSESIQQEHPGTIYKIDEANEPVSDTIRIEPAPVGVPARLIGEAFDTYILVERGGELLLVDKHAAHERIRYEQLKTAPAFENRQVLLTPITVSLSREDYGAITEEPERLGEIGFTVDDFGDGTVLVREVPVELGEKDVAIILGEVAEKLRTGNRDLTPEVLDRLYYSIACKSAVRAGDKTSPEELAAILKKLEENPEITHCPHGRPVSIRLTRSEIEKRFGRLG
jgi:DNA mismatch repair protein MutL